MNTKRVTAIDLGSSKIVAVIADLLEDGTIEVKGIGKSKSQGLSKGKVIDITDLSVAIEQALEAVKKSAQVDIDIIYVSIGGSFIKHVSANGKVTLSPDGKAVDVKMNHLAEVIKDVEVTVLKQTEFETYEIIHSIPKYFTLDSFKEQLKKPIMMKASKIEGEINVILAEKNILHNIRKSFEIIGHTIDHFVLASLASAMSILSREEQDLGCITIDIGAGISDCIVYNSKYIQSLSTIEEGGAEISQDLYTLLKTPPSNAELIKHEFSKINLDDFDWNNEVEVKSFDGHDAKSIQLKYIREIMERRIGQTLENCYKLLKPTYNTERIAAGLILTGGSCNLNYYKFIARETFNLPVKIGIPNKSRFAGDYSSLIAPEYATVTGILQYSRQNTSTKRTPVKATNQVAQWCVKTYKQFINYIKGLRNV